MNWQVIIIVLGCVVNFVYPTYLYDNEKLIRVRKPEEAKGRKYFIDFIGLAQKFNYTAEQHKVITEDGYILEIFRIPPSPTFSQQSDKKVVLIQNGFVASSDTWALMKRSMAYVLADAGYDVWVGNYRGNVYGRSHQTLSPKESLFWNYTWHEIGALDYAATIDYILEKTNKSNLTLVGHSMGGTASLVLLSDRPKYNKKINLLIALAPGFFWKKTYLLRILFQKVVCTLKDIVDPEGYSELLPLSSLPLDFLNNFCKKNNILQLCIDALSLFIRAEYNAINKSDLFTFFNYYPAGISTKTIAHFCQLSKRRRFALYDYGSKNPEHYGQVDSPEYNWNNIVTKTYIFYSDRDLIFDGVDAELLASFMSNNPMIKRVASSSFTHLDFIIGIDVKALLYDKISEIIANN
ncbi:lipase member J-like [Chelonus insularis]|uniref:lipase member J-like n=1 Tax=Chelonus insularis TaxID=460826 RepID=UPI00158DBB0C|nr:lipase member J-like [Chelonus insularis]